MLSDIKIYPDKIEITGGKLILGNISTIYTKKVGLDNIKETGSTMVNLALNPASLKIAPGSKDKIKVAYVVKPKLQ